MKGMMESLAATALLVFGAIMFVILEYTEGYKACQSGATLAGAGVAAGITLTLCIVVILLALGDWLGKRLPH